MTTILFVLSPRLFQLFPSQPSRHMTSTNHTTIYFNDSGTGMYPAKLFLHERGNREVKETRTGVGKHTKYLFRNH